MAAVFTFPGKCGDALLQWPVAHHFHKQTGETFECWLDEKTCKPLVPLLEAQPGVSAVKLIGGVSNYSCGGQPWHFDLPTSAHDGNTVYHLGLRGFPQRQITLETFASAKVPITVSPETLSTEATISLAPFDAVEFHMDPLVTAGASALDTKNLYSRPGRIIHIKGPNRLLLHGQGVCPHNQATPTFWRFIAAIRGELESLFDEIVFVGSPDDLEVGMATYPLFKTFEDHGDLLKLAEYMAGSRAMIGCGSMPIVLAGCMRLPGIRVHDLIANGAPKVIWNNLSDNHINETEIGLRKAWPLWRDTFLLKKPLDSVPAVT